MPDYGVKWFVVALLFCASASDDGARTWTSKDGKFQISAALVGADSKVAKLKRDDGVEIKVPLAKLSDEDTQYVSTWLAEHRRVRVKPKEKAERSENQSDLVDVGFKIFEAELTMRVPQGAKLDTQVLFPTFRFKDGALMNIQPHSESDLTDFKKRFGEPSDALAPIKTLIDEDDAAAYTVNVRAFNSPATVYMVVVEVDGKKYTCFDSTMEDMNRKRKYTSETIERLIRSARTLSVKSVHVK